MCAPGWRGRRLGPVGHRRVGGDKSRPGVRYFFTVDDVDAAEVVESCMAAAVVPVGLTVVAAGFVDDDPHAANGNTRAKPAAASTPPRARFECNMSIPPSSAGGGNIDTTDPTPTTGVTNHVTHRRRQARGWARVVPIPAHPG